MTYAGVGSYFYEISDISYLYEAFDFIKKLNTTDEYVVIMELKTFILSYFGYGIKDDDRDQFILQKFLEKNKKNNDEQNMVNLVDFKKSNKAKCSEIAILINQVLNLL